MRNIFLAFSFIFCLAACEQTNTNKQKTTVKMSLPSLAKEQKMDTAFFWQMLDYAFDNAQFDNKVKEQIILEELTNLTPEQIEDFEIIFQQMNLKASTWNNLAAETIIEGGSLDDRFYYFRCWLISLGKHNFEETMNNPDCLANLDIPVNKRYRYGEASFEELISISDKAYTIVTGKNTEDETFPRNSALKKGLYYDSNCDIKGTEWTDDELPKIAPKLFKKFSKK